MNSSQLISLAPLLILILFMYFCFIKPQKKKEKAIEAMRKALKVGDEVITIGGICGKIVKTKDETIVIQVGAEKIKFEMMRWSISSVVNRDAAADAKKEAEEKKEKEKAQEEQAPKKSLPKKLKKAETPAETTEAPVAEAESVTE